MGDARKPDDRPDSDEGRRTLDVRPKRHSSDEPTHVVTPGEAGADPATDTPGGAVGHYTIGAEVARGGLGRVVAAYDQRLQRDVAIKELIARAGDADTRFLREARLTARLQHPSIVPVYETDHWPDGKPFYAMKLVRGRSFLEVLGEHRTLRERLSLLPTVLAAAEAIAYAHDKRIIHRDIKPANIVVGPFGETVVVDWGLAKALDDPGASDGEGPYRTQSSDVTAMGTIVGTPSYMPPEQAAGEVVDERADVYALGALLYQTLSGVAPYAGKDTDQVLEGVRSGPPVPIEERVAGVPAELAAIVHQAMARDRQARYRDGAAFAEDLRRFQSGQLVAAHRYSLPARALRFVARHRSLVALSAAFTLALGVMGAVALARIVRARDHAERARIEAERQRARAVERGNEMILAGARAALDRNPTMTLAWLKTYPLDGAGWDEARSLALEALGSGAATLILWPDDGPSFPAISPDGSKLATKGATKQLELRDLASGRLLQSVPEPSFVWRLKWTHDGTRVLVESGGDERFQLWTLGDNSLRTLAMQDRSTNSDLSPDGHWLVYGGMSCVVSLVNLDSGITRVLGKHPSAIQDVGFFPDGKYVASASEEGLIEIWSLADGTHRQLHARAKLAGLEIAPDGRHLVTYGDHLEVWDVAGGGGRALVGHSGAINIATFSPDGRWLASGGDDHSVRVWDWQAGTARVFAGHTRSINRLRFDSSSTRLVSGSRDATLRVWDVPSGDAIVLRGHGSQVVRADFDRDARYVVSSSADQSTRVWSVPHDLVLATRAHEGEGRDVRLLDATHAVSTGWEDGLVRLSDLKSGAIRTISKHAGGAGYLLLSADHDLVASNGRDDVIELWRRSTDRTQRVALPHVSTWAMALSCDGGTLALDSIDGSVRLFDIASGTVRLLGDKGAGGTNTLVYSPDCRTLVSQSPDSALHLWDVASGRQRVLTGHDKAVTGFAFSADGARLLTASIDKTVRLWNLADGSAKVFSDHSAPIINLAESADRSLAVTGDFHGDVRVWSLADGSSRQFAGHSGFVNALAFSPDGKLLATGASDQVVRIWDVASGAQLQVIVAGDTLVRAEFTPDAKQVVTVDNTGRLRVWRVTPRAPASRDPAQLHEWLARTTSVIARPDRTLASP